MNRPSRSQHNLLDFIEHFIRQHGYGPSYREIKRALDYKSISTVAVHVNGLVAKGSLRKHGRSARSLEVISSSTVPAATSHQPTDNEAWLVAKIDAYAASSNANPTALREIMRSTKRLGLSEAEAAAKHYLRGDDK